MTTPTADVESAEFASAPKTNTDEPQGIEACPWHAANASAEELRGE